MNDGGMVPLRVVYEGKQFDSSHGQRTGTRKLKCWRAPDRARAEVLRRPKGVDHVPCSRARGAWRFCGERSLAGRPPAGEVHRRDVLRGREARDRRARDARLHGNLQGQTGLGPGHGYGVSERLYRDGGTDTARGEEPAQGRHLRRVQQGATAGGSHRRDLCCPAGRNGLHAAHHAAESAGRRTFIGQVVSSDLFYDPTEDPATLWGDLGVLAVEMEAAAIFTIAAMRGVKAGCLLTVSDTIGAEIIRISDDELRSAVDNMMALALDTLYALN